MNAWRDRSKRRQREISFEYLTEEKYHSLSALDGLFINPYEEYPVTICGQTIMLNSGEFAEALSVLPEKKREIIYLYFFGRYTQQEIGKIYGRCLSVRNPKLVPYETIVRATNGEPEAVDEVLRHYGKQIRIVSLENGHVNKDTEDSIKQRLITALFKFRFDEQPYKKTE